MTVSTRVIRIILHENVMPFINISDGLHIQVLPSIEDLPRCQKHQYAAFIADRGMLIIWDDDPHKIVQRVAALEETLVWMAWGADKAYPEEDEKKDMPKVEETEVDGDVEDQATEKPRPIALCQAIYTAFAVGLTIATLGLGWRQVAIQSSIDHTFLRALIIVAALPLFWLALVCIFVATSLDCYSQRH